MKYFSKFVDEASGQISASIPLLPLIHTTSLYSLREILNAGNIIKPMKCSVFNQELTYLFYGKASYVARQEYFSSFSLDFPITFIIDPNIDLKIERIIAFDSGALHGNIYKNYIPEKLKVENYTISEKNLELDSASKIVKAFYLNNTDYYYNSPRKDLAIDNLHFEVETYFNLISSKEAASFDERSSTIEIQISNEINLETALQAVILPDTILSSQDFMKMVSKAWGNVEIISYSTFRAQPAYFAAIMVEKIGNFLQKRNLLGKNFA